MFGLVFGTFGLMVFAWWRMTRQVKIKVWLRLFLLIQIGHSETKNGNANIGWPFSDSRESIQKFSIKWRAKY